MEQGSAISFIRGSKKDLIGILMESSFYFELTLEERKLLINTIYIPE